MSSNSSDQIHQRSREEWRALLRRRGIRPERSMGQNFLTDPDVVGAIVESAAIKRGDDVVEVGPGLGILTRALLEAGASVTAIELDRDLAEFLRADIREGPVFSLVEADARHVDLPENLTGVTWHLVANLPYSTGNVILRHMLEMEHPPATATVMVQKEVAERMVATAPNMSLLSLAVQVYAEGAIVLVVPPEVFEPPPNVDSAVVRLLVRPQPLLDVEQRERLFELATLAFQQKRKTLANSIARGLSRPKGEIEGWLADLGIDPGLRPQAVSLEQWCTLAAAEIPWAGA